MKKDNKMNEMLPIDSIMLVIRIKAEMLPIVSIMLVIKIKMKISLIENYLPTLYFISKYFLCLKFLSQNNGKILNSQPKYTCSRAKQQHARKKKHFIAMKNLYNKTMSNLRSCICFI